MPPKSRQRYLLDTDCRWETEKGQRQWFRHFWWRHSTVIYCWNMSASVNATSCYRYLMCRRIHTINCVKLSNSKQMKEVQTSLEKDLWVAVRFTNWARHRLTGCPLLAYQHCHRSNVGEDEMTFAHCQSFEAKVWPDILRWIKSNKK